MDRRRFDALARALSSAGSRREAMTALLVGLLGLGSSAAYVDDPASAKKRKNKNKNKKANNKRRKKRRQGDAVTVQGPCGDGSGPDNRCEKDGDCCTRNCNKKKRRCRCLKEGQACSNDRLCCPGRTGRTCLEGSCQQATTCLGEGETCADELDCCAGLSCQDGACLPVAACGDVCASGCQYNRIQDAIDDPDGPETIRLCAETYEGTITINKDLMLIGSGEDVDGSVLDGQGDGSVVTVATGATVELQALRVTGGHGPEFSAGGITNFGTLTLTSTTIVGNQGGDGGGGIHNRFATLMLINSTVTENSAADGGGIYNAGGVSNSGQVTLDTCWVTHNTASAFAGGLYHLGSDMLISNSFVEENKALSGLGGGIYGNGFNLTISESTVTRNKALNGRGGGMYFALPATIADSIVTENEASEGGGIFNGSMLTLNGDNTIENNVPDDCLDRVGATGCP